MPYKAGQAVAFSVTTVNPSTGAKVTADSLPTATLWRNGVVTAETVTVTDQTGGDYKVAFTIPTTYDVGDTLQIKFAATVNGIAGEATVWSVDLGQATQTVQTIQSRTPGLRADSPFTIDVFQASAKSVAITVTDANGDAVDLSGLTLRFIVLDVNETGVFDIENASITISGSSNEIATVPISSTNADALTTGTPYLWRLLDVSNDYAVLAYGSLNVLAGLQAVP